MSFNSSKENLNDVGVFDVILSTPKSGKFIELYLEAGGCFYKVRLWRKLSGFAGEFDQLLQFSENFIREVSIGNCLRLSLPEESLDLAAVIET
jgi:hypothetical protein